MKTGVNLAFDSKSVRSFDKDGLMHVSKTPITKANVCKYQGKEIPDYEQLGLDPNKWYRMYRDPEELKKGADTFNNKPVLNQHIGFTPLAPPKDAIVGMTGDDVVFEHPYLYQSMTIYDAAMQAGIESDKHREISSSYYWRADMTPGTSPEDEEYDGVMRDLSCNHVAIVPDGRAGSDVLVYDSKPKVKVMSKISQIMRALKGKLASDADPEDLRDELENIVDDEDQTQAERDNESEAERLKDREERERRDRERDRADDEDEEGFEDNDKAKIARLEAELKALREKNADDAEETEKKVSMACDAMRKEQIKERRELREAEQACRHIVGDLACDSAEELYRATLESRGIDAKDIHRSALKAMVNLLSKPSMANDSAPLSHGGREEALKMIMGDK